MNMILHIDRSLCVGYGECVAEDPEAVELDGEGCARKLRATLDRDRAERLCSVCPTGAISLEAAA
jgi:ferredoxin